MSDYQEMYDLIDEKVAEAYARGYEDRETSALAAKCDDLNKALERGRSEAWELARKIILGQDNRKQFIILKEIFGISNPFEVLRRYSVDDVMEKVRAWEEKQKKDIDDGDIKVGDEVIRKTTGEKGIVTNITWDIFTVLWSDGLVSLYSSEEIVKTGKNFTSDVSNLLSMIKSDTDSKDSF